MSRRLTIVVELNNLDEQGVDLDDAEHTAGAVLDGDVSQQLVSAQWGDPGNPVLAYEIRFEASAHPEIDALRAVNQAIEDLADPKARQRVAA